MDTVNKYLSIIVTVYNEEKYLPECIDSLLKTDGIDDAEIIIVDDGSKDESGIIADKYAESHGNIRVIHKDNGGAADARNMGMKNASGKYISFCDGDDLIVPEHFAKVIKALKDDDIDIVLWDGELVDKSGKTLNRKDSSYYRYVCFEGDSVLTGKELLAKQLKMTGDYPVTVCFGAYKKEFLIGGNFFFETGIVHEDDLWVPKVLLNAASIKHISEKLYLYRVHDSSVMNPEKKDWSKHIESLIKIYPELYGYADEVLEEGELKKLVEANFTRRYLHWIYTYDFYRYGYGDKIDKEKLKKTAGRFRDKVRTRLLCLKG